MTPPPAAHTVGPPSPTDEDLLRHFLGGRDVQCPGCGYNLRDLPGDRCPECGQGLALRLQLAEPRLGAMIAGLVGLSAGAGLNGLLLIYLAMQVLVLRRVDTASGMGTFLVLNLAGLAVQGSSLAAWLWGWRRIRRLPAPVQRSMAVAAWVMTLLNIILFSVAVR